MDLDDIKINDYLKWELINTQFAYIAQYKSWSLREKKFVADVNEVKQVQQKFEDYFILDFCDFSR